MKAKRFLSLFMACTLLVSLCACSKEEPQTDPTTETTTTMTTKRAIPDYSPTLIEYLGVEPEPSSFDELKDMALDMRDPQMFYKEYEERNYCELVYNGNHYCVIRYEKAQEWFEYYFTYNDYLSFENDDQTLVITDESYTGPEGMLMMYHFRVFVDNTGKYLFVVLGYDYVPDVSDADINTFKTYFQTEELDVEDQPEESNIDEEPEEGLTEE